MSRTLPAAVAVASLALLCTACATSGDPQAQTHEEKVYRTGSNLPQREGSGPSRVQTADPSTLQDAMRNTATGRPGGVTGR
jgi:hypothetical protein